MFEQNAAHFGSTVESLLYRYGKVKLFDLLCIVLFRNFWSRFIFNKLNHLNFSDIFFSDFFKYLFLLHER